MQLFSLHFRGEETVMQVEQEGVLGEIRRFLADKDHQVIVQGYHLWLTSRHIGIHTKFVLICMSAV